MQMNSCIESVHDVTIESRVEALKCSLPVSGSSEMLSCEC